MRKALVGMTACAILLLAQSGRQNIKWNSGLVDASVAAFIPPTATFASPPSPVYVNAVYLFTDASALGTCTGGGSAKAQCQWNGSSWLPVSGGGGGISNVPVQNNGTPVGNATTLNFVPGTNMSAFGISCPGGVCSITANSTGGGGGGTSGTPDLTGGGSTVVLRSVAIAKGTITVSGGNFVGPGGSVALASSTTQAVPLITGLNGDIRYDLVLVSEHTIFAQSGSITNLSVGLGRSTATPNELMGPFPLMQSSSDTIPGSNRPGPPILGTSNTYTLNAIFQAVGGNLTALSGGVLNYEVHAYSIN